MASVTIGTNREQTYKLLTKPGLPLVEVWESFDEVIVISSDSEDEKIPASKKRKSTETDEEICLSSNDGSVECNSPIKVENESENDCSFQFHEENTLLVSDSESYFNFPNFEEDTVPETDVESDIHSTKSVEDTVLETDAESDTHSTKSVEDTVLETDVESDIHSTKSVEDTVLETDAESDIHSTKSVEDTVLETDVESDQTLLNSGKDSENSNTKCLAHHQMKETVPTSIAFEPRLLDLYQKAIRDGKEKDNTIRVNVIGCYGQGKSSLIRCLSGQSVEQVHTTNGIDVYTFNCPLDSQNTWNKENTDDISAASVKRLISVASSHTLGSLRSHRSDSGVFSDSFPSHQCLADILLNNDLTNTIQAAAKKDSLEQNLNGQGREAKRHELSEELIDTNLTVHEDKRPDVSDELTGTINAYSFAPTTSFPTDFVETVRTTKLNDTHLEENCLRLSVWDFGGQFVYYSTHQLFHSRQAIYLLVFNISESINVKVTDDEYPNKPHQRQRSMKEYLQFWVHSVHSFVGNEQSTEPPIFLIGTHLDKLSQNADVDECFEEIRKLFDNCKSLCHIQQKSFAISNITPSEDTLNRIRETIIDYGRKHYTEDIIPAKWIPLERRLKKSQHLKIISFEKLKELDATNEVPIGSDEQLKLFLQYHHEKGTFFYYESDNDDVNHIVLQPQFLIDAFKCIITSEKFCRVNPKLRRSWQRLCNEAVLEKELLQEVWNKDPDHCFMDFEQVLLFFLQRHRIIAEALQFDDSGCKAIPLGFYIVPSFMKASSSEILDKFLTGKMYTETALGYAFECDSVIPVIYNTVTAAALGKWPLLIFQGHPIIFENVSAVHFSSDYAGLLLKRTSSIELLVVSLCPPYNVSDESDLFRRFVELVIGQELNKFQGTSSDALERKMKTIVRCYNVEHGWEGSSRTHRFEALQQHTKKKMCCPDYASHSLDISLVMRQWFKSQTNSECFQRNIPKRQLSNKEFSKLSRSIGENWQSLARELGIDEPQIQQIRLDIPTTADRIYKVFQSWSEKEADQATLDVLIKAIEECKNVLTVNSDTLENLIDRI